VLVGVLALVFRTEPEPEHGGVKLSVWVERNAHGMYVESRKVVTPFSEIGTNAIPFLLKWIRYEEPTWKEAFYGLVNSGLERLNPDWELTDKQKLRADGSVAAFAALGRTAEGAVSELATILNNPKASGSAERAAYALGNLGPGGLAPLLAVLTNQQAGRTRLYAAISIQSMGTNVGPAVPVLMKCLRDNDENVVSTAALVLYNLKVESEPVVTALIARLQSSDDVRRAAAYMLGHFEEKARSAVPPMLKLLNDRDAGVRQVATYAIRRIDPEALEKATAADKKELTADHR